jgi:hypothetical protein
MKKEFFYLVSVVLLVTSFVCLGISAVAGKPDQLTGVLIAVMVLSNLFLVIVMDWKIWDFFLFLFITAVAVFVLAVLSVVVYPVVYGLPEPSPTFYTYILDYGIRLASVAWSVVLLYNGILHYEKLDKEEPKAKQTETKETEEKK